MERDRLESKLFSSSQREDGDLLPITFVSLIFLVESRYKLITKGMCDFKFFFLKLIIVGCVDLSYTHMYFGKILSSRDIEE